MIRNSALNAVTFGQRSLGRRGSRGWDWYRKWQTEGAEGFVRNKPPRPFDWSAYNGKVSRPWFEISVEGEPLPRIEFELAEDICPKTCANFRALCDGSAESKHAYKGSKIHHILKGVTIMGGDVEDLNGRGGHSASASSRFFDDENFIIPHSEPFLLSMASRGRHTNSSQFYIDMTTAPHLNGRCVVFGRVSKGTEALQQISKVFTMKGRPAQSVVITDAGVSA